MARRSSSSKRNGNSVLVWAGLAVLLGITIWLIVMVAKNNNKTTSGSTAEPPAGLKQILESNKSDNEKENEAKKQGFEIVENFSPRRFGRGRRWGWRPWGRSRWNYWYAPNAYNYTLPVYNYTTPIQCQFFDAVQVNGQCPTWLPKQSLDNEGRSVCCSS